MEWFWFVLVVMTAGWIAAILTHGRGFGLLGNTVIGVLGAFLGAFIANLFGWEAYGIIGSFCTATAGAIVLLVLLRLIHREKVPEPIHPDATKNPTQKRF